MDARGGEAQQDMKLLTWLAFALAIIGGIVGTAGLILATSAQSQLSQEQRLIRAAQAALTADEAALNSAQAKINGTHRDLITCGDLQMLVWPVTVNGNDAYGNGLNLNGVTAQLSNLPQHCINQ